MKLYQVVTFSQDNEVSTKLSKLKTDIQEENSILNFKSKLLYPFL